MSILQMVFLQVRFNIFNVLNGKENLYFYVV